MGATSLVPGQRMGPWRLQERLAGGGMGVVYRAVHVDHGQVAALKTLLRDEPRLADAFRREVHALSRLRHPGLVRVLDQGQSGGRPWVAMELIEGVPLRAHPAVATEEPTADPTWVTHLSDAALTGIGWDRAEQVDDRVLGPSHLQPAHRKAGLTLFRRLCEPLAWLHGEGLAHGDLKPENVLVREDGSVVLIDFGLTVGRQALREHLDTARLVAGTLAYMAPEQVCGEPPAPRSDLYALGCMLYEWAAGRPPFVGDPRAVARAHVSQAPRLPDGMDPPLAKLVSALLAKRPADRPRGASLVARWLVRLGAAEEPAVGPPPRPALHRAELVGRDDVIARLRQTLLGEGPPVLLVGESGSGKTRVLLELARVARDHQVRVCIGSCPPPDDRGARRPLGPLQPALAAAVAACAHDDEVRAVFGAGLGALGRVVPALQRFASEDEGTGPEALDAASRGIASLGARVVVLLDDIQWADDLTLGWIRLVELDHAQRADGADVAEGFVPCAPVGLVCASRAEERPDVSDRLERLRLPELSGADGITLAGELLGGAAPPDLARALEQAGPMRPFHLAVWLEVLLVGGALRAREEGWEVVGTLPPVAPLADLVGQRLAGLEAAQREVLEAAAILGRRLELTSVAALNDLPEAQARDLIAELVRQRFLAVEPDLDAEGAWSFAHDQLREHVLGRLPVERARALHARAAAYLGTREAEPAVLAHHHQAAGDLEPARQRFLDAAQRAAAASAYTTAEGMARAALALSSPRQQVELRLWLVRSVLLTRDLARAAREAEEVLEAARALQDPRLLLEALILAVASARDPDEVARSEALAAEGEHLAQRLGDTVAHARMLEAIAAVWYRDARMTDAVDAGRRAQALYDGMARPASPRLLQMLGLALREVGAYEEAGALLEALITRGRSGAEGAVPLLGSGLNSLAGLRMYQGQVEVAERLFREALRLHRLRRDRVAEGYTRHDLCEVCRELGRLEEARQHASAARQIFCATGHEALATYADLQLADLAVDQGQPAQAMGIIGEVRAILDRDALPWAAMEADLVEARAAIALGKLGAARRLLDSAAARMSGATLSFRSFLAELSGDLWLAEGQPDEARRSFQAALACAPPYKRDRLERRLATLA